MLWQFPLFSDLSEGDLIAIAQNSESRKYREGDILFREGDDADGLYLVLSGQLQFSVAAPDGRPSRVIGEAGPGEYVGEFSLLDGKPRSATVRANKAAEITFLSDKAFEVLLKLRPTVARGVHKKLADIVRRRTGRVISLPNDAIPTRQDLGELTLLLRKYNDRLASQASASGF
jgi:CRP/FNR family cyclic AMP-dependent transcriptional regulator